MRHPFVLRGGEAESCIQTWQREMTVQMLSAMTAQLTMSQPYRIYFCSKFAPVAFLLRGPEALTKVLEVDLDFSNGVMSPKMTPFHFYHRHTVRQATVICAYTHTLFFPYSDTPLPDLFYFLTHQHSRGCEASSG